MSLQTKAFTGITLLAILLTAIAALFSANLLITGIHLPTIQEIPEGSNKPPAETVETVPYPPAIPMLVSSLVLLGGLLARKLWIAWAGWAVLGILSGVYLFSSGAALVPIDLLLLLSLIALTLLKRRN